MSHILNEPTPGTSGRPASHQTGGIQLSSLIRRSWKQKAGVLAALAVSASVLVIPNTAGAAQVLTADVRLAGANRYDTSAAIAAKVPCSSNIVLVSGETQAGPRSELPASPVCSPPRFC